jgi:hypothetical protein
MDREEESWPGGFCVPVSTPILVDTASASDFEPFDERVEAGATIFAEQSSTLSEVLLAGTGSHATDSSHLGWGPCMSTQYTGDASSRFSATFVLTESRDVRMVALFRASAYNLTWSTANASTFVRLREQGGATLAERQTTLSSSSPPSSCDPTTPCNGDAACEAPCNASQLRGLDVELTLPAGTYVLEADTTGSAEAPGDVTLMLYDEGYTSGSFNVRIELLCGGSPCTRNALPVLSGPTLAVLLLLIFASGAWATYGMNRRAIGAASPR